MNYIPSIDGLRAIAVLIVVLFHAGFSWMGAGYIGVDVFFVISGFLITNNIMRDKEQGTFSYTGFYKRRIARLFPALFTTILLSLLAAYLIVSPVDIERIGKSSLFSALSLGNIFFWYESGYFDRASELKPLLHTWSLAVEEQFYLLWPALLSVLFFIGKRKAVIWGLIGVSLVSLGSAIRLEGSYPDAVFFLTPFRVYQFGIGALIALCGLSSDKVYKQWLAVLGACGIVILAGFGDAKATVLYSALLPGLCAGLFLVGSTSPLAKKVFGSPVFVWLGQRSYSIYLTHWPVMVFWKINTDYEFSDIEKVLAVAFSIISGFVLHLLVEKRFRFSAGMALSTQTKIIYATTVFVIFNLSISTIYWAKGPDLIAVPEEMKTYVASVAPEWGKRGRLIRYGQCDLQFNKNLVADFDVDTCLAIDADRPNWLVVGDSFAADTYMMLSRFYKDVNFLQLSIAGCPFRAHKMPTISEMCDTLISNIYEFISSSTELDGVVVATYWGGNKLMPEILEIAQYVEKAGKDAVVFSQRLGFREAVPSILSSSRSVDEASRKAQSLIDMDYVNRAITINERMADKVTLLDIIAVQCPNDFCDVVDDEGNMLYIDAFHVSVKGADFFGARLKTAYPDLLQPEAVQ